ncbi:AfsR/SARP family transcriptional regulator [Actinoallomurus oryzae]
MSDTCEPLRLELLGPMRIWRNGREVVIAPSKQRAVLGLLGRRVNDEVRPDEIIDAVWGRNAPKSAANCVHVYIARLRKVLEPERGRRESGGLIVTSENGYSLRMDPENVDVERFLRLHTRARRLNAEGRPKAALEAFEAALGLWRGDAYVDLSGPFAELERTHLAEMRLTAVEDWAAALLAAGRHTEVTGVLAELVAKEPLRERLRWLLMLALYRGGRRADALTLYRETWRLLGEELGIEPGPDLQRLHEQILTGSFDAIPYGLTETAPAVAPAEPDPRDAPGPAMPRPAQLPPDVRGFVGRERERALLRDALTPRRNAGGAGATLVVIDGAAGVGKTALAVHVAHRLSGLYPDGQLFADLCAFNPDRGPLSASAALASLLSGLGVREASMPSRLEDRAALYRRLLHDRRMLIVLDDASGAEQVRPLIPDGPVCVLVTSRRRQAGLVARDGARRVRLAPLAPRESLELLTYLAGPGRLASRTADARRLAELCGHVPLALRIVAEQLAADPSMTPAGLAGRYAARRGRLDRLTVAGDATASLRSIFAASYCDLPPQAARMFRLLGRYGARLITVSGAAVLAGVSRMTAEQLLELLAADHLLEPAGRNRYRFPALIDVYAAYCAQEEPCTGRPRDAIARPWPAEGGTLAVMG